MAELAAPRLSGRGRQSLAVEAARDFREEMAARAHEAHALAAALRSIARALEVMAWSAGGDLRTVQCAMHLRALSDQHARRWEPEP